MIAEDLVITPPVKRMRESSGSTGWRSLQLRVYAFERHIQHVPAYHEENQVIYTGTHDNTDHPWLVRRPGARAGGLDPRVAATSTASSRTNRTKL